VRRFLLALVGVVVAACGTSSSAGQAPGRAVVSHVVDGDTIDVTIGGHRERVRLIGINTPETVDPRRPVECFGHEASLHTSSLLPAGTEVDLVRDVEPRDAYGRLLAYVYRRPDGLFVNLDLAEQGYADLLTFPPNIAHVDEFRGAVAAARRANRGLWSRCRAAG
jgi:endonuclease YncB( thermonuclease family)